MSSNRYADKSIEELGAILKAFHDNYHKQFDADPDVAALKLELNKLATKKQEELFARHFSELSAKNLRDLCDLIDKQMGFEKPKDEPVQQEIQPVVKPKKQKGK